MTTQQQVSYQQRWSAGVGVITAMIAATLAVLGVTLVFGGYKSTVDSHTEALRDQGQEIRRLNQQVVTKDDFRKLEDSLLRLENKLDNQRRK